jgi:nicotinamide-nucleotide amidase
MIMDAEILAVGTELLMGQIANTNAQYISKRMQDIGVNVYYHSVVGDNPERLKSCLHTALARADLVVMTGGLGPTQDDLTKETVARAVGKELVLHEPSLEEIRRLFIKAGWTMTENNFKQAYFPEGSIVMKNNHGTAPGCIIETGEKILIMLPGPPSEMKPMFEQSVMPYLEERSPYKIVSKYINTFGIGESALENMLIDLIEQQKETTIATYVNNGQVTVRLTSRCDKDNPAGINADVEREIRRRLGNRIFSVGSESLAEVAGKLLIQSHTSIAVAESFTGGLISAALLKIPGVSQIFARGSIALQETINQKAAEQTAQRIREQADSDLGLAVLGSVEDGSDNICIALAAKNREEIVTAELNLPGGQDRKRNRAVLHALDMIRLYFLSLDGK